MDVIGSCSYPTSSWSRVVRLLEHGLVDFEPIVTHRFPTARFEEAFALLDERRGMVAKVVLEHLPTPEPPARREHRNSRHRGRLTAASGPNQSLRYFNSWTSPQDGVSVARRPDQGGRTL